MSSTVDADVSVSIGLRPATPVFSTLLSSAAIASCIHEERREDAAVILNQVKTGKGAYGYNAATGEFGDMLEEGILDPTKVTRLALQNAASVAGLLLTTEVMVAEAPKGEEHAHGGMLGGGMGGMGGMDM